jgi:hypothetical protein
MLPQEAPFTGNSSEIAVENCPFTDYYIEFGSKNKPPKNLSKKRSVFDSTLLGQPWIPINRASKHSTVCIPMVSTTKQLGFLST